MMHSHRKRECTTTRYCVLFIAEIVLRYTVFKVRNALAKGKSNGGLKWIRTIDLTVISRTL